MLLILHVNRINRFRDIVAGSWPKKSEIFLGHPLGAEGPCRAKRELSREARVSRRQAELPGARSAPDEARM